MAESVGDTGQSRRDDVMRLFERPIHVRSVIMTALLVLAVFYTLYFARFVLIPVALALIFNLLLGPIVTRMQRWHIPRSFSALLIIGSFTAVVCYGGYMLMGPAQYWINRAPEAFSAFNEQTQDLQKQIKDMNKSTEELKKAAADLIGKASQQTTIQINEKGLRAQIMANVQWAAGILFMTLIMLYFMLCSRGSMFRKLLLMTRTGRSRRNAVRIVRHLQADIGRYLATVTAINIVLGACAAGVLWAIGLTDPILWGVLVGLLNFAPYAGAAISLAAITLASFATFDTLAHILLAPAAVFALNVLEGNFITPAIHGRRFEMSPLMVFFALFFWGWLWGVAGMLMAVPLLVVCKVTCDHIAELRPIGRALGR
ncbi:AI-2E family transporter [Salinisphaera sp. T31B1]|uniref:AI-2E family transporter n=1 Tax=Salinisphaera sp. T31B1 TaxID=727963 RepID=UPI00334183DE